MIAQKSSYFPKHLNQRTIFFPHFRPFWVDAGKCLTADISPTDPLGEKHSVVAVAVVVVVHVTSTGIVIVVDAVVFLV